MWNAIALFLGAVAMGYQTWRAELHENRQHKPSVPLGGFDRGPVPLQGVFQDEMRVSPDNMLLRALNLPAMLRASGKQARSSAQSLTRYRDYTAKLLHNLEDAFAGKRGFNVLPANAADPSLSGVICNPLLQDCESAADAARVFGETLRSVVTNSALYRALEHGYDVGYNVYEVAKSPLTDALIDTLEMEPLVQTVENAVMNLSSPMTVLKPAGQNPYTDALREVADNVVFDAAERLGASPQRIDQAFDRAAEVISDLFVEPSGARESAEPSPVQRLRVIDASRYRVVPSLYLRGFIESCNVSGGCFANAKSLFPQLLDGFYQVYDASPNNFVVYRRAVLNDTDEYFVREFRRIYNVPPEEPVDVFLWMDSEKAYVTIGSYGEEFKARQRANRFLPYAELHRAKNREGTRFEYERLYEELNSASAYWKLQTGFLHNCKGVRHERQCVFPANLAVLAVELAE